VDPDRHPSVAMYRRIALRIRAPGLRCVGSLTICTVGVRVITGRAMSDLEGCREFPVYPHLHVLRQGSFTASIPVTGLGQSAQARSNSGSQQANTVRNQAANSAPSARGNPANSFGSSGAHGSATGAAQSGGNARPK
jgi:hypothetical protein